eukprot:gene16461-biopygen12742
MISLVKLLLGYYIYSTRRAVELRDHVHAPRHALRQRYRDARVPVVQLQERVPASRSTPVNHPGHLIASSPFNRLSCTPPTPSHHHHPIDSAASNQPNQPDSAELQGVGRCYWSSNQPVKWAGLNGSGHWNGLDQTNQRSHTNGSVHPGGRACRYTFQGPVGVQPLAVPRADGGEASRRGAGGGRGVAEHRGGRENGCAAPGRGAGPHRPRICGLTQRLRNELRESVVATASASVPASARGRRRAWGAATSRHDADAGMGCAWG